MFHNKSGTREVDVSVCVYIFHQKPRKRRKIIHGECSSASRTFFSEDCTRRQNDSLNTKACAGEHIRSSRESDNHYSDLTTADASYSDSDIMVTSYSKLVSPVHTHLNIHKYSK